MTPPSRLAVSTPNPSRTISSSPWQSATRGENGRRSRRTPQTPATRVADPPNQIPNEAINSLKTNNPIGFVLSFPYPDRRALSHQPPDLVHLLVRHRDTPLRPVALQPDPVPQTVYHDAPAGVSPRLARARHVRRIRVRNMQRQMVLAARVPPVDGVPPLRRSPVAFLALGTFRLRPQRDLVGAQHALPSQEQHLALFLAHHHQIRPQNPASHHPSIPPSVPMAHESNNLHDT